MIKIQDRINNMNTLGPWKQSLPVKEIEWRRKNVYELPSTKVLGISLAAAC